MHSYWSQSHPDRCISGEGSLCRTTNTKLRRVSGCPGACYRGVHHVMRGFCYRGVHHVMRGLSTFRTQVNLQSSGSLKLLLRDAEAMLYAETARYFETAEKYILQSVRPSKWYTIMPPVPDIHPAERSLY